MKSLYWVTIILIIYLNFLSCTVKNQSFCLSSNECLQNESCLDGKCINISDSNNDDNKDNSDYENNNNENNNSNKENDNEAPIITRSIAIEDKSKTILDIDNKIQIGDYYFELSADNLYLKHKNKNEKIWYHKFVKDGDPKLVLQSDGNLVLKNTKPGWSSNTSGYNAKEFKYDSAGCFGIYGDQGIYWGTKPCYRNPLSKAKIQALQFPITGIFYYTWFPETWSVDSHPVQYMPSLGHYKSVFDNVINDHLEQLNKAKIDMVISSWWGADDNNDNGRRDTNHNDSRTLKIFKKIKENNYSIKWSLYYEPYQNGNIIDALDIAKSLKHIKKYYIEEYPGIYAYINVSKLLKDGINKNVPIVFVYNVSGETCEQLYDAWYDAVDSTQTHWHVIFKVISNYRDCKLNHNNGNNYFSFSWHQYGPDSASQIHAYSKINDNNNRDLSQVISPGYREADSSIKSWTRTVTDWNVALDGMVNSKAYWKLITSFNEWGEGHGIEKAINFNYYGGDVNDPNFYLNTLSTKTWNKFNN